MLTMIKNISPLTVFVFEVLVVACCAFFCPIMASTPTHAEYEKEWKCPYCHHHWKYGEICQNEECPSNQW
jgi:hypothetical protein